MGAVIAGARVHKFPLLPDRGFLPDLDSIPTEIVPNVPRKPPVPITP